MKPLPSVNLLREYLDYSSETGVFVWRKNRRKVAAGSVAGSVGTHGYLLIRLKGIKYRAHRLAWKYVHGTEPELFIDHINGDCLDNRICNLRLATQAQNQQNHKRHRSNTSGCAGVTRCRKTGRWIAKIRLNGKRICVGRYESLHEAGEAYREAKRTLHPFYTDSER
ncbi:HNH endonuclease [Stenotrophomonas geniculata]|uniref:HNH endonuclease n=1 Tax=Stenotrophomonas geniculata TaxID=86188 RepID=UPI003CCE85FC